MARGMIGRMMMRRSVRRTSRMRGIMTRRRMMMRRVMTMMRMTGRRRIRR